MKASQAGPELDAEIQRVVFGKEVRIGSFGTAEWWHEKTRVRGWDSVPRYSTDRETALTLLLDSWHGDWEIRRQNDHYQVTLYEPSMQGHEWDESLPLAICRIILRSQTWPLSRGRP